MFQSARRYLLIIALLLCALVITWGQRWSSAATPPAEPPAVATVVPSGAAQSSPEAPRHTYFVDVEGWYRITPYETVLRSPYDLRGEDNDSMAAAIPGVLGEWVQVGPDRYVGDDPAVQFYLKEPTVAFERTYQDTAGQNLTLTIIGNRGKDSFLLFSHTPETCYPGRLWQVVDNRRETVPIDGEAMHTQYLLTEHAETGERLLVLYWYLWDNPQRDSEEGVLSMRVNLFIPPGQGEQEVLDRARAFIRQLFPATVPWDRF